MGLPRAVAPQRPLLPGGRPARGRPVHGPVAADPGQRHGRLLPGTLPSAHGGPAPAGNAPGPATGGLRPRGLAVAGPARPLARRQHGAGARLPGQPASLPAPAAAAGDQLPPGPLGVFGQPGHGGGPGLQLWPLPGQTDGRIGPIPTAAVHIAGGGRVAGRPLLLHLVHLRLVPGSGRGRVARLHASREQDFRVGRRYGRGERLMFWRRPARPEWLDEATYQAMPPYLCVREILVHVAEPGRRTRRLIVATTLLDRERYSREAVAALYGARWQVELDIRSLKSYWGLGELRCQSPEMLAKELWGGVLAYNLVRKVACQAACLQGLRPRQVSFTAARQALCAGLKGRVLSGPGERRRAGEVLLERLGQERVGGRPGRVEPRATKRGPKGYPRLRQPRARARARLQR